MKTQYENRGRHNEINPYKGYGRQRTQGTWHDQEDERRNFSEDRLRGRSEDYGQDFGEEMEEGGSGQYQNYSPGSRVSSPDKSRSSSSGHETLRNENRRGEHRGKGPKGYMRSDERIKEDVCEALASHDEIDASDIDVEVSRGEVTLTGTVDERRIKRLAEDAIENLSGVKDITNQLRVKGQEGSRKDWEQQAKGERGAEKDQEQLKSRSEQKGSSKAA